MDELRARAFLDLVLGKDSRPRAPGEATDTRLTAPVRRSRRRSRPGHGSGRRAAGGFAGRVTLTVPLGDRGWPGRPARRALRLGPVDPWLARDLATARRAESEDDLVRDGNRQARPRRRPRLRPARTHKPQETRRAPAAPGRDRVLLHPRQPGRAARRIRHLAATRSRRRAGPDRRDRHPGHPRLRRTGTKPGVTIPGSAPAPVPDPARHLHQPGLPAARQPVRFRAQHAV